MKIRTIKLALRGFGMALVLVAPSIGWAGDHYLGLINVSNVILSECTSDIVQTVSADKAIVGGVTGSTTRNLILRVGLCNGTGAAKDINETFATTTPLILQLRPVKMCKNWTVKGGATVYGWLDQGSTRIGATGELISNSGKYKVVLAMGTVSAVDVPCTADNQGVYDYSVTRTATVVRISDTTTLVNANFTFGNTAPEGNVPEPGTLSLIGLGLAGLGWMGAKRARKTRVATL